MRAFIIGTHVLFFSFLNLSAQDVHISVFGGFANYSGDLQTRSISFDQALFHAGGAVLFKYSNKLMLRAGISFAQVSAQDQYQQNELRRLRNLSFASNILEIHAAGEFHFLGMSDRVFSPYLMGGLALFHFNPYAYAPVSTGRQKVFLKPISTEGQGLNGINKPIYSLMQIAIPFGAGVRMKLTDKWSAGAEFGYRKTFTDYIDDVSTTYVDPAVLLQQRGPLALQMAFRTPELSGHTNDPYPTGPGSVRGGKAKDNYYFLGLSISYRLSSGSGNSGGFKGGKKFRSKMGCPTNVW